MLAHRYCVDCKQTYNELSKIIQGVLASRRELVKFDQKVEMGGGLPSPSDEEEGAEGLPESGSATLVLSPRTKVCECMWCVWKIELGYMCICWSIFAAPCILLYNMHYSNWWFMPVAALLLLLMFTGILCIWFLWHGPKCRCILMHICTCSTKNLIHT